MRKRLSLLFLLIFLSLALNLTISATVKDSLLLLYDFSNHLSQISQKISPKLPAARTAPLIPALQSMKTSEESTERIWNDPGYRRIGQRLLSVDETSKTIKTSSVSYPLITIKNNSDKSVQIIQPYVLWQNLTVGDLVIEPSYTAEEIEYQKQFKQLYPHEITHQDISKIMREYNKSVYETLNSPGLDLGAYQKIIIGGSEASCGYQMVKNSIALTRALFSGSNDQQYTKELNRLLNITVATKLFAIPLVNELLKNFVPGSPIFINKNGKKIDVRNMGFWRRWIVESDSQTEKLYLLHRPDETEGDWLTQEGVAEIVKKEKQQYGLLDQFSFLEVGFININEPEPIDLSFAEFDESIRVIKDQIGNYKKSNNYFGIFFIVYRAHWIAVLVNKLNNKSQFIVADSLIIDRSHEKFLLNFINLFLDHNKFPVV